MDKNHVSATEWQYCFLVSLSLLSEFFNGDFSHVEVDSFDIITLTKLHVIRFIYVLYLRNL